MNTKYTCPVLFPFDERYSIDFFATKKEQKQNDHDGEDPKTLELLSVSNFATHCVKPSTQFWESQPKMMLKKVRLMALLVQNQTLLEVFLSKWEKDFYRLSEDLANSKTTLEEFLPECFGSLTAWSNAIYVLCVAFIRMASLGKLEHLQTLDLGNLTILESEYLYRLMRFINHRVSFVRTRPDSLVGETRRKKGLEKQKKVHKLILNVSCQWQTFNEIQGFERMAEESFLKLDFRVFRGYFDINTEEYLEKMPSWSCLQNVKGLEILWFAHEYDPKIGIIGWKCFNETLTTLALNNVFTSIAEVKAAEKCFEHFTNLTSVSLANNYISVGLEYVLRSLKKPLESLQLCNTFLRTRSVNYLANCLHTKSIKHLDLSENLLLPLPQTGMDQALVSLFRNIGENLDSLELQGVTWQRNTYMVYMNIFKNFKNLRYLNVSGNVPTPNAYLDVVGCLPKLTMLILPPSAQTKEHMERVKSRRVGTEGCTAELNVFFTCFRIFDHF